MFKVRLSRRAIKYYKRLDANTLKRLDECFSSLKRDPFRGGDIKPIRGLKGVYRIRVGALRVIYEVDTKKHVVTIYTILPRGDVYKR